MNLNKVFLIGRLTADPQLRTTPAGQAVGTFSLATNRVWSNKSGEKQQEVQFHNIVVWGRQAEVASQFLKKGSMAMIEGRLQTREWQSKEGDKRRTTEIVAERMQLGPRSSSVSGGGAPPAGGFGDGGFGGFEQKAPTGQGVDESIKEELPEINIDEGEIKPENIPF